MIFSRGEGAGFGACFETTCGRGDEDLLLIWTAAAGFAGAGRGADAGGVGLGETGAGRTVDFGVSGAGAAAGRATGLGGAAAGLGTGGSTRFGGGEAAFGGAEGGSSRLVTGAGATAARTTGSGTFTLAWVRRLERSRRPRGVASAAGEEVA